jgi:hypothetical protein
MQRIVGSIGSLQVSSHWLVFNALSGTFQKRWDLEYNTGHMRPIIF